MKTKLKIWFSDFTEDIDPKNNYFTNLLGKYYQMNFDKQNPDYLIFSSYGYDFLKFKNAVKIYYTGENLIPDFNLCDYAIGFHFLHFQDRYLRFPYFATLRDQFEKLLLPRLNSKEILADKPYFCNYIYANPNANPFRKTFFIYSVNTKMLWLQAGISIIVKLR